MKAILPTLIPWPTSVELLDGGSFVLQPNTRVIVKDDHRQDGRAFESTYTAAVDTCLDQINAATGFSLGRLSSSASQSARAASESSSNTIEFALEPDAALKDLVKEDVGDFVRRESYSLRVEGERVTIITFADAGIYYACQTFRQLLPPDAFGKHDESASSSDGSSRSNSFWRAPSISIVDKPRFEYRGAMLDVGRHFMPKSFVMKFIDVISTHKMNRFHWHLTEDQGWRIEIKKYPRLTEQGSYRRHTLKGHAGWPEDQWTFDGIPHAGFYTQEEVKEVVAYAAKRFVEVIPEIELPGHSQAAIAAYPELGNRPEILEAIMASNGGEKPKNFPIELEVHGAWGVNPNVYNVQDWTLQFLKDVFEEVLELFPSKLIHIGGDECPKLQWKAAESAQMRIQALNLKDEKELQSWFIGEINEFLLAKGRKVVGWDEILEGGLARDTTVMSWRGLEGGFEASKMGHKIIATPLQHTYFDYYQSRDIFEEPREEPFVRIGGQLPLEKVYEFDVVPANFTGDMGKNVLGTQGQLWTEYIKTPREVEWMAFPRLCALAEIAWSTFGSGNSSRNSKNSKRKSFADFESRLKNGHLARLAAQKVDYFRPPEERSDLSNSGAVSTTILSDEGGSMCIARSGVLASGAASTHSVASAHSSTFTNGSTIQSLCDGGFYVAQRLEDGVVVGRSFATEEAARKFFDERVCPHFGAIILSRDAQILDFWGE